MHLCLNFVLIDDYAYYINITIELTLIHSYDPLIEEYPQQCLVKHNVGSVRSRTRHLTINDRQYMFFVKGILIKCQFNIIFINI